MLIRITAAKCMGISAVKVMVEVEIGRGIGIHLVGLADVAVKESLLRTSTALMSLDYRIPGKKIVINLAPADLRKNGGGYDLPIAVGIIAASGQRELPGLEKYIIMGELGLDGSVRPIPGALPMAETALMEGMEGIILPLESSFEAVDLKGIKVYGVSSLEEVIRILMEKEDCDDLLAWNSRLFSKIREGKLNLIPQYQGFDFSDIIGQEGAKRAIEIAAAGGHNIIMVGTPGCGKSSLAKAMAGILPPMSMEEALLTSKIYSVVGKNIAQYGLIKQRPFRAPHYSASLAALIGGGGGDGIIPGEVSLATNGVLFLDEIGQMPKSVIEALRSPLEDRSVTISRLKGKIQYPASFILVAASNPCPCGYYGEGNRCTCSPSQRNNYMQKLSGPIMDRIDLQCRLRAVDSSKILQARKAESSAIIAERVLKARLIQEQRFAHESINTNAEMNNKQLEQYCPLSQECKDSMIKIMDRMNLSMRAFFRITKVARTIADLGGEERLKPSHLLEAASYRFLDKRDK